MTFAKALKKAIEKSHASVYEVSQSAHIDYSHVRRLLSGEASRPARQTILQLGQALLDLSGDMTLDDVDALLKAVGKGKLRRERITITKAA